MNLRIAVTVLVCALACETAPPPEEESLEEAPVDAAARLDRYTTVRLTTDTAALTDSERKMIPHLVRAAEAIDRTYWEQAYGDKEKLLSSLGTEAERRYAEINYGPWDRLDGDAPFLPGFGEKPKGARFYPLDATKEEIEAASETPEGQDLLSHYTVVERDAARKLRAVPYAVRWKAPFERAAALLGEEPLGTRDLAAVPVESGDVIEVLPPFAGG